MSKPYPPALIAKEGSEHAIQTALIQWVALEGARADPRMAMLFAVPNGGAREKSVAAAMVQEGVRKGVPDLCLPVAAHGHHSLYIEMKKPGRQKEPNGGLSDEQVKWRDMLRAQGHAWCVCYSWLDARAALCAYLGVVTPNAGWAY